MSDHLFKLGNKAGPGRPKGSLNKRTKVGLALDAAAEDVTKAVIAAAKGGDMQAARLCLERIEPPKRPEGNRVNFKLDTDAPISQQSRQVLAAMACGEVEVEIGQIFLNSLSTHAGLIEHDELSKRITELEFAAKADASAQGVLGCVMRTATEPTA